MIRPQFLNESINLAKHNYALIDRLFYNEIDSSYPVLPIVTPIIEAQAQLYPYLLPLDELSLESWSNLCRLINQQVASNEPPLCAIFFKSDLLAKELCGRLADYLIKSIDRKNYILRYYDPKILVQLFRAFSQKELEHFLEISSSDVWTFYLNSQWNSIIFKKEVSECDGFICDKPINIKNIGIINRVLLALPKARTLSEYVDLSERVSNSLDDCEKVFKIYRNIDRELFAKHCMTIHSRFYNCRTMSTLLSSGIENEIYYTDIINNITETQWDIIKYECTELDKEMM